MDRLNRINHWNLEVDAWRELCVELLEAMQHDSILLSNNHDETKEVEVLEGASQGPLIVSVVICQCLEYQAPLILVSHDLC